jgi:DNA-binding CsgD family transcriptional regulator
MRRFIPLNVKALTKWESAYLLEWIQDALRCADIDQVAVLFSKLKNILPFEFAAMALLHRNHRADHEESVIPMNINFPNGYLDEYMARGYEKIDPVMLDNMTSSGLHYWEDSFERYGRPHELYALGNDFGFTDASKGYGYGYGLANDSATERGLVSFYGLRRSGRTETILSLVVPHLQVALKRSHRKDTSSVKRRLSTREKEILQWGAAGKSVWDVSRILNISERTVKFHLDNLMKKLDAVNRTHAVAIALREKIIELD